MNIAIGSAFRNSAGYIDRYMRQVTEFEESRPNDKVRFLLEEGDSTDDSYDRLRGYFGTEAVKHDYGAPFYGSVNNDDRWKHLSRVWEGIISRVRPDDDVFIYVESDLIWTPEDMNALIARLGDGVDMACPMLFRDGIHYDTWGMRGYDGVPFSWHKPYHRMLEFVRPTGLYPILGFGNCAVMKAEVARTCHFVPPELMTVGFCRDALAHGYKAFVDPNIRIRHP